MFRRKVEFNHNFMEKILYSRIDQSSEIWQSLINLLIHHFSSKPLILSFYWFCHSLCLFLYIVCIIFLICFWLDKKIISVSEIDCKCQIPTFLSSFPGICLFGLLSRSMSWMFRSTLLMTLFCQNIPGTARPVFFQCLCLLKILGLGGFSAQCLHCPLSG